MEDTMIISDICGMNGFCHCLDTSMHISQQSEKVSVNNQWREERSRKAKARVYLDETLEIEQISEIEKIISKIKKLEANMSRINQKQCAVNKWAVKIQCTSLSNTLICQCAEARHWRQRAEERAFAARRLPRSARRQQWLRATSRRSSVRAACVRRAAWWPTASATLMPTWARGESARLAAPAPAAACGLRGTAPPACRCARPPACRSRCATEWPALHALQALRQAVLLSARHEAAGWGRPPTVYSAGVRCGCSLVQRSGRAAAGAAAWGGCAADMDAAADRCPPDAERLWCLMEAAVAVAAADEAPVAPVAAAARRTALCCSSRSIAVAEQLESVEQQTLKTYTYHWRRAPPKDRTIPTTSKKCEISNTIAL